jgi:cyclase
MLKKRIIPCLDIQNGKTVKGVNFIELRDAGDPIVLAKRYVDGGADELVFLDISATIENRKTFIGLVEKIARELNIPFTVGGGISSVQDALTLIKAGADKVSINSAAIQRPRLISEIAQQAGSQAVVLAIDARFENSDWHVYSHGGTVATGVKTIDWAMLSEQLGAGEILLTSMNHDGTKNGFALSITHQLSRHLNIPIIASGGAGSMEHFKAVFEQTKASGALAASIFHFGEVSIQSLKTYLKTENISVR